MVAETKISSSQTLPDDRKSRKTAEILVVLGGKTLQQHKTLPNIPSRYRELKYRSYCNVKYKYFIKIKYKYFKQ